LKSFLEDNYDLICFNSKLSKDINEVKLVSMMGSRLMIVMFENNEIQNNEIQNQEINTARRLNIPILFIYDTEADKENDIVNAGEHKIVFKNIEDVEMILKDRFKLIEKIKKRQDLPFETLVEQRELFKFTKLNSISILKEKNKLILAGDIIQSYDLHKNTPEGIQSYEFNEGHFSASGNNKEKAIIRENISQSGDNELTNHIHKITLEPIQSCKSDKDQLDACVNNKAKEIIVFKNNVFYKYNFEFEKISEVKIWEEGMIDISDFDYARASEDTIESLDDDVIINEIVVNEENKHVYGTSYNSHKLFHFNSEFRKIETMNITTPLLIKVSNKELYILLNAFKNSKIEGSYRSQIIENENSFIGVYFQEKERRIKIKRKIILDVLIEPIDFHVDEKYILFLLLI
jgi:hypothetical protein